MQIIFVLVEPKVPENVGAAARALKTMGHSRLWIVNSQAHQEPQAQWLAHGSQDILEQIETLPDLQAVRDRVELVVGTSAKPRHGREEWHPPQTLRRALGNKSDNSGQVALVFGPEERGLSNEELALCDLLTGIPLKVRYPSLNLAQAVMLYAYELASASPDTAARPTATETTLRPLIDRMEALLPQIDTPRDGKLAHWLFERLPLLTSRDIGFLHTLCQNLERTLRQGRKQ
ncbi:tRNA/rRNA methyltransferase [Marinobacteraceae bacterium S3BR75-40.1]